MRELVGDGRPPLDMMYHDAAPWADTARWKKGATGRPREVRKCRSGGILSRLARKPCVRRAFRAAPESFCRIHYEAQQLARRISMGMAAVIRAQRNV